MTLIYMDHHATTPLDPEVLEAMMPYLTTEFGNPSSNTHEMGHTARIAVETGRTQIALLIGATSPDEIVLTSGATEADNLALKGIVRAFKERVQPNIITIAIEHKAILDTVKSLQKEGVEIRFAKIDSFGRVDVDDLRRKIDSKTVLISIQTANSEIGVLQPIDQIGKLAREHKVLFHTDAVQALGRIDVNVQRDNIDLLSISAHKMYGPKGIGGLYVRKGVRLVPMIEGGGHERGMRSGTLNVPGIVGMGKAAEIAKRDLLTESSRLKMLRDKLAFGIQERIDQTKLNGHPLLRLPNNLNVAFSYVEGEALLLALKGFALSTGSACTSTSLQSSYVLKAIGVPDHLAHSSIRFGLGKSNDEHQIDLLLDQLTQSVKRLREMSPLYDMAKEGIDINNYQWPHSH